MEATDYYSNPNWAIRLYKTTLSHIVKKTFLINESYRAASPPSSLLAMARNFYPNSLQNCATFLVVNISRQSNSVLSNAPYETSAQALCHRLEAGNWTLRSRLNTYLRITQGRLKSGYNRRIWKAPTFSRSGLAFID